MYLYINNYASQTVLHIPFAKSNGQIFIHKNQYDALIKFARFLDDA